MRERLEAEPNIAGFSIPVTALDVAGAAVVGVSLAQRSRIRSSAVVVTTAPS
jgi:tRNA U34 5-carboxymethylaminomethyl modifying enzyme MnmG/GidA